MPLNVAWLTNQVWGQLIDHNKSKKNDWFNNNCRRKRKFSNIAGQNCRFNMNEKNVHNLKLSAKEYKMEIRKAKFIYHKSFVHKLQSSRSYDLKTFWTMIHKKNKRINNVNVSVDAFFDHFSKLNDKNERVNETCSDSFVSSGESNNLLLIRMIY